MKKYSSTELHYSTADILDTAITKPVVLTKYNRESHVLMSFNEFLKMKELIKKQREKIRGANVLS
jgi:hypothetical protein